MSLIKTVIKALYAKELTPREQPKRRRRHSATDVVGALSEFLEKHRIVTWMVKVVSTLVLAVIVWGFVHCYNDYSRLHTRSKAYFAQVGVELKRRNNLIPNLVTTARRYASHEADVFKHVCDAREVLMKAKGPAQKIQAANMLDSALSRLMAIFEQYPDLKATQSIQDLIKELANTEDRIADQKTKYNEVARGFNQLRQTFPTNILGRLYGFDRDLPYLGTTDEMLNVPEVDMEWMQAAGASPAPVEPNKAATTIPEVNVEQKEGVKNEDG